MYAYPERITDAFIAAMKRNEKVLPYLDLPIQHCNDVILKNMNRRSNRAELLDVIGKLRREIPGITLRTTLIAGFPGETEEQFEDLCNFVKEVQFDRLAALPTRLRRTPWPPAWTARSSRRSRRSAPSW